MTRAVELLDVLEARTGIVCAVGAAGKKTTLYRLLRAHPGRVGVTSTVYSQLFPESLPAHAVIDTPDRIVGSVLAAAGQHHKLAYACPSDKPGRHAGLTGAQVAECHCEGGFDLTLVKADGARMRLLKAPDEHEPQWVPGVTTVLGLVSARVIGMPLLARHVHRPERVAAVTGAAIGETLTAYHVARLIASEDGLLRGVGTASMVPIINMADNERHRGAAMEAARIALELSDRYQRVVVARMRAEQPIVAVLTAADGNVAG